jgi:hypothetical protein
MTAGAGGQQFSFGSGYVYGIPLAGTNLTPVLLGTLQDCSYDISSSTKELFGQNQFAVAVGRGQAKFTGKAKMGSFSAEMWNTFFFGPGSDGSATPTTTNAPQVVNKEIGSPVTHAYQFANNGSGSMDLNLGVYYTLTGLYLTQVASGPAIGQYSFNAATGTWTFNSGDTAANAANGITVAYSWIPTVPSGRLIQSINNNAFPMGSAPLFEIVHNIPYGTGGTDSTFKIYAAMASKLSFGFKNTDFTVPDIDFTMQANSAGKVFDIILYT